MNLNPNTSRLAAAVLAAGIALGVTACGEASGETSDTPKAPEPVVEKVDSGPKDDSGPKVVLEPRKRCYPRGDGARGPQADLPTTTCVWE